MSLSKVLMEYQNSASGRRVARNIAVMSAGTRLHFLVNHYISKISLVTASVILMFSVYLAVRAISGTWIAGGSELLSDNLHHLAFATGVLVLAIATLNFIPFLSNVLFAAHFESGYRKLHQDTGSC